MRRRRPAFSCILRVLLLFLLVAAPLLPLSAQDKDYTEAPFDGLLFEKWSHEAPSEQIHWKTRTFYVGLSNDQRLIARLEVWVDGKELTSRGNKGRLLALVKITDSAGHVYQNEGKIEMGNLKPEAKNGDIMQSWECFVLPGDYMVALALYHTETREHNFATHRLHVPALKNDPLPNAWHSLPAVEFWAPGDAEHKDVLFHPEIQGRLSLPLATRYPLHLQVLADFSPSDLFHGSERRYGRYLYAVVPVLKALAQIEIRDGVLDLAILDLLQKRVTFEQSAVKDLDWPRLKAALNEMEPGRVSVQVLKAREQSPVFLRDELARRIAAEHSELLRVFILIGSPLSSYSFGGLGVSPLGDECHCRVFYLEYDSSFRRTQFSAISHVKKMLRPLEIHAFSVHSPEEMRRVIAKVMNELSEM